MKIVIATDKFKHSLSAVVAGHSIAQGIIDGCPKAQIKVIPMADGGEGTLEVIYSTMGGEYVHAKFSDPFLRKRDSAYLMNGDTAYIEMASICGLQTISPSEYNPLAASSAGLGEAIVDAVKRDAKKIYITIGGSASNDLGCGMLYALGVKFEDVHGVEIIPQAASLQRVAKIDVSRAKKLLKNREIFLLSDVKNPLLGENGAASVYSPQKGADRSMVDLLERSGSYFAELTEKALGVSKKDYPGAGAAGGVGFAILSFFDGEFIEGWRYLSEICNLEPIIMESDLVITGEGSYDAQSMSGKIVGGVTDLALKHNKRVWIFCGINKIDRDKDKMVEVFDIMSVAANQDEAITRADIFLRKISREAATFLLSGTSNLKTNKRIES